jgi:hypothetical protein
MERCTLITLSIRENEFFAKERSSFLAIEEAPKFIWNSNLTMLQVTWISISLAFAIEVLLVLASTIFFNAGTIKPFVADLAQKIIWSVIVCVGLAVGRTVARERENFMGLAGFLAAPTGFFLANLLQQNAAQALTLTPSIGSSAPLFLIAFIKAVEYGCLGLLLEWIEKRPRKTFGAYLSAGLIVGNTFGGMVLFAIIQTANHPLTNAEYLAKAINEIIFPIGCSLVIYASKSLGRIKVF